MIVLWDGNRINLGSEETILSIQLDSTDMLVVHPSGIIGLYRFSEAEGELVRYEPVKTIDIYKV